MTPRSRTAWRSGPALRLHAALLIGLGAAGVATWFEWTRAHSGHAVAWVYTFEWPLLAAFGVHLWWRLLHGDRRKDDRRRTAHTGSDIAPPDAAADTDPGLAAWQAYLARLHETDPPGRADPVDPPRPVPQERP